MKKTNTISMKSKNLRKKTLSPNIDLEKKKDVTPVSENIIVSNKKLYSIERWKQYFKKENWKNSVIANIELRNGNHRTVHVKTNNKGFEFEGSQYLLDEQMKYYNIDLKTYCLDYHQDFALPMKRVIPLNKLNKAVAVNESEVELATNPELIKRFVKSEIAEGIMKGAEISEFFKKIYLILIVTALISSATLILLAKSSGLLDNLNLPF